MKRGYGSHLAVCDVDVGADLANDESELQGTRTRHTMTFVAAVELERQESCERRKMKEKGGNEKGPFDPIYKER